MQDYQKIIEYVNSSPWNDDTDPNIVISKAENIFKNITLGKTKQKFMYRLCGQTGSGKTTQLLESIQRVTAQKQLNPVILGVRTCSETHPDYEYFRDNYPAGELREKTNGFALKCMSYVLKLLLENGYMILLDITLLDPVFESFVLNLANKNNYTIEYHLLAVNKIISDQFIEKRFKNTGRIIYKASSDYFYHILPIGLKYLTNHDSKNNCYIWTAFDLNPQYHGKICNCYNSFLKSQSLIKPLMFSEEQLIQSKIKIINKKIKTF